MADVLRAVARLHLRSAQFNLTCAGSPILPDKIDPVLANRIRKAALKRHLSGDWIS